MPMFNNRRNRSNRSSSNNNNTPSDGVLAVVDDPDRFAQQAETLIPATVYMISGCHSEQTSADVSNLSAVAELPNPAGKAGGACTSALLEILFRAAAAANSNSKTCSFQQILLELRQALAQRGFDQIPQLTSSRPLNVGETPFQVNQSSNNGGTCRALLVGINYRGQRGQLSGCHNDVLNVKQYLLKHGGYLESNILVLMDDGHGGGGRRHHAPTRKTITFALKQLVEYSNPGDSVYFHYSGHGGLLDPQWNAFKSSSSSSNSNNKAYDETLFPLDHARAGQIRDFDLFRDFVRPMPAGVVVICVMDCCHSGSVLELPYAYRPTSAGSIRMSRNMNSLSNIAMLYLMSGFMFPGGGLFDNVAQNIENVTGGSIENYQGAGVMNEGGGGDYSDGGDGDASGDANDYNDGDGGDYGDSAVYETDAMRGDTANAGGYEGADTAFVVPGEDVQQNDYDGFGDTSGTMWNGDGGLDTSGWDGVGGGDVDPDMDCGCFADILGALLED